MTLTIAGIKAVLSTARTAKGLVARLDPAAALKASLDASAHSVETEISQVSYAAVRALVANALGRDPFEQEVDDVMSAAVNDPSFPHRAHRLLGEARKSGSRRRRAFLASMLFGMPFAKLPDDERDRVDMAVERMVPEDVELLSLLVHADAVAGPPPEGDGTWLFRGTRLAALMRDLHVVIATTDDLKPEGFEQLRGDDADPTGVNRPAFAALNSLGCLEVGASKMSYADWGIHTVSITALGRLVDRAIRELRPGFDKER